MARQNNRGHVAPRLSVYNSSAQRSRGRKATVPIYKVLAWPVCEPNSRPTSTEADARTTKPHVVLGYQ